MKRKHSKYYYGLVDENQAKTLSWRVCSALGHGVNQTAHHLVIETACAESQLGTYMDTTPNNGFGLHQLDRIGIRDTIERTRRKDYDTVRNCFGISLERITPDQVANDPLVSTILCRLKYKLVPEEIPADLLSRAVYWKRYYNTAAGKGTTEHYLASAERLLYQQQRGTHASVTTQSTKRNPIGHGVKTCLANPGRALRYPPGLMGPGKVTQLVN
ncbi:hypothetical protein IT774_05045 [Salinimonas marina]|uniref:Transglycosylase SLT domain-containing protein n=1 Tax=Salinimonas marina TaxID=2785918 RepID=A0A7S9HEC8_9ALTE|nr:hypothetical protein [Salinimonas marina]QPG06541.1 hypothetical protein IT774_05045 [Salinimonas marina]